MKLKVDVGTVEDTDETARLTLRHAHDLEDREHGQILDHRDRFAEISYGIMRAWVAFIIILTTAQFALKPFRIGLSEAEFMAVVTSTTAAVFGFGLLVGNFLFPKGGSGVRRR